MFTTSSGQTGHSAYVYELAQISNEYRELNSRLAKLTQAIADELPLDATGTQSIASERYPDASMPVDTATYRRQLAMFPAVDHTALDMLRELLAGMDEFKPVEPVQRTADDFSRAGAILQDADAPQHVVADLFDEADFLSVLNPDAPNDGGITRYNVGRYLLTSRASRRQTVCRWMNDAGKKPTGALRDALELIGGLPVA